jgi:hypothetical protein
MFHINTYKHRGNWKGKYWKFWLYCRQFVKCCNTDLTWDYLHWKQQIPSKGKEDGLGKQLICSWQKPLLCTMRVWNICRNEQFLLMNLTVSLDEFKWYPIVWWCSVCHKILEIPSRDSGWCVFYQFFNLKTLFRVLRMMISKAFQLVTNDKTLRRVVTQTAIPSCLK